MATRNNKFFILDSVAGWRAERTENLLQDETGFALQKVPGKAEPLYDAKGALGGMDYPTGLAVDRKNNIYISDTLNHIIIKYEPCNKEFVPLKYIGGEGGLPRQFRSPRGLAVSKHNDLYVIDAGNNRIQVFSLKGLVLRYIWGTHGNGDGQFDHPTDIAIDGGGNVYVVDSGNRRVQKFSRSGKHIRTFGKEGNNDGEFLNPAHIAVDKSNRVYVTDELKRDIQVFDSDGKYLGKVQWVDEVQGAFHPLAIAIDESGHVFIGSGERVYKLVPSEDPVKPPAYNGKSQGVDGYVSYLIFDDSGNLYASLRERGFVVTLKKKEEVYESGGFFITKVLDSKIYKCQWHRIMIDADLPEGTSIEVQTYSSETERDINDIESDSLWTAPRIISNNIPKELLVLSGPGRYLWVKVALKGNVIATPTVKMVRADYPRQSYLRFLPGIYQEDEGSRQFLERFLSIFQTILSGIETKIDNAAAYFNPFSTPREFLPWLASWLAMVLDENWPEKKKRELIRRAETLYKKRGTPAGLLEYLEIYTGLKSHVHIIEHYKLRRWMFLGESKLGCSSNVWSKGFVGRLQLNEYSTISGFKLVSTGDPVMDPFRVYAHRFSIVVPSSFCDGDKKENAIRRIADMEKPAHTQYSICKVGPRFRVGLQSTIGIDTIIGVYPEIILGFRSTLGIDSVLGQSKDSRTGPVQSIGKRSRIGIDTAIN